MGATDLDPCMAMHGQATASGAARRILSDTVGKEAQLQPEKAAQVEHLAPMAGVPPPRGSRPLDEQLLFSTEGLGDQSLRLSGGASGRRKTRAVALGIGAFVVGLMVIVAVVKHAKDKPRPDTPAAARTGQLYAVMFDAGSSGTRAHVYSWPEHSDCGERISKRQIVERGKGRKKEPGLSTLVHNVSSVPGYLAPLLDYVREAVPGNAHSTTPIYLQATAGLRLLSREEQDKLIGAVQAVFGNSGFAFKDDHAFVSSGQVEGANEWATVNYLRGTLGGNLDTGCYHARKAPHRGWNRTASEWPAATLGMGGASTQIAFSPAEESCKLLNELDQGFDFTFKDNPDTPCNAKTPTGEPKPHGCTPLHLHDAVIYVHSYLGLGATEAQVRLRDGLHTAPGGEAVDDPCLLSGNEVSAPISRYENPYKSPSAHYIIPEELSFGFVYGSGKLVQFHGTGDYAACADSMLQHVVRTGDPCPVKFQHQCSFNGTYQPKCDASRTSTLRTHCMVLNSGCWALCMAA
eukprot:COSAG05_NODE_573_length_8601_cov_58.330981_15_plen_518_part_00